MCDSTMKYLRYNHKAWNKGFAISIRHEMVNFIGILFADNSNEFFPAIPKTSINMESE